jgi:hypothetical protein
MGQMPANRVTGLLYTGVSQAFREEIYGHSAVEAPQNPRTPRRSRGPALDPANLLVATPAA